MTYYPPANNYDSPSQQDSFSSPPDNNMGLWAMILGIVSFFVGGLILGIPAIVMGVSGRKKAEAGQATNGGQALAGIILGSLSTVLTVFSIIFWVAFMRSSGLS
jgi:hypothetical protein